MHMERLQCNKAAPCLASTWIASAALPMLFLLTLSPFAGVCALNAASACVSLDSAMLEDIKEIEFNKSCVLPSREVPREVCAAPLLESLTLDGQPVDALPSCFPALRYRLKSLLLFSTAFQSYPRVLDSFQNLSILSFKGNQLQLIPENSLPASIQWLILTSNRLAALPESIGALTRLRKLMLASNTLTMLPASLCDCESLELIRFPNNQIAHVPLCLWNMSRLTWVAMSANPASPSPLAPAHMEISYDLARVATLRRLGGGASGNVYLDTLGGEQVVVKIFKGLSSDGRPEDEVALTALASSAPGVLRTIAFFRRPAWGMVMEYVVGFVPLAGPPSMASMTRDVYRPNTVLSVAGLLAVVLTVASACHHLHTVLGIMHGDLYAHNILVDASVLRGSGSVSSSHVRLSDFGAASRPGHPAAMRLEVRAFGILLRELLAHTALDKHASVAGRLAALARQCVHAGPRPTFADIKQTLQAL